MLALSAYGRDGLWEEVADRLVTTVRRRHRRSTTPSEVVVMIVYLARYATEHAEGLRRLVAELRRHWQTLDADGGDEAKQWLATYWPDVAPDGPPPDEVSAPDAGAMQAWIRRSPLFARAN